MPDDDPTAATEIEALAKKILGFAGRVEEIPPGMIHDLVGLAENCEEALDVLAAVAEACRLRAAELEDAPWPPPQPPWAPWPPPGYP